jgi:hypothetical protein
VGFGVQQEAIVIQCIIHVAVGRGWTQVYSVGNGTTEKSNSETVQNSRPPWDRFTVWATVQQRKAMVIQCKTRVFLGRCSEQIYSVGNGATKSPSNTVATTSILDIAFCLQPAIKKTVQKNKFTGF